MSTCPSCGRVAPSTNRFCRYDGFALAGSPADLGVTADLPSRATAPEQLVPTPRLAWPLAHLERNNAPTEREPLRAPAPPAAVEGRSSGPVLAASLAGLLALAVALGAVGLTRAADAPAIAETNGTLAVQVSAASASVAPQTPETEAQPEVAEAPAEVAEAQVGAETQTATNATTQDPAPPAPKAGANAAPEPSAAKEAASEPAPAEHAPPAPPKSESQHDMDEAPVAKSEPAPTAPPAKCEPPATETPSAPKARDHEESEDRASDEKRKQAKCEQEKREQEKHEQEKREKRAHEKSDHDDEHADSNHRRDRNDRKAKVIIRIGGGRIRF